MNTIRTALAAPEGQTFLVVVSAGFSGCWYRSTNLVSAIAGINDRTTRDFGLRKGKKFVATIFLVDDVDWTIGVDGIHSEEGAVHDRLNVRLAAKDAAFFEEA